MKRIFYLCQFLMILQILNPSSVFGQASVYSSKRGGVAISIDDTPDADSKVSAWESNRLLFNKYGFKFNIGLQSEGLSRKAISDEVKLMMNDGHEMLDHCPQNNIYQFYFQTHLEDSLLYIKKGIKQSGVQSVLIEKDKVTVSLNLKAGNTLDPLAIPVLAGRTRLLYKRYLKDSINYPKILAQPGGTGNDQYIFHKNGYIYENQAGYTGCTYDGGGKDTLIPKTYNINQSIYHPAYNITRVDWNDLQHFDTAPNWIANSIAKHQVISILYHYTDINPTFLDQIDKLLKWCQDKNIPILTLSQWNTNLNNSTTNPSTNVFPDFTADLDGDGKPDGYETFYDVTINKSDAGAPGGSSLTKYVGGNFLEIRGLGGIEKGKNSVSFSAKGQVNATIRLQFNSNNNSYCDTVITLNSTTWKTYKANVVVPDNVILSNINFLLNNVGSGNFVSISNIQLNKGDVIPAIRIRDSTITIKQTVTLTAEPGCTNYKWSTGETTQSIVIDGTKNGPGIFSLSYTADRTSGVTVSDNCVITVKGLINSPNSFSFPAQNASGTLKITANIPWTITSKRSSTTFNPASGTSSIDVAVSMTNNVSASPVDDTLKISSSQIPINIPLHQAGASPLFSVSQYTFSNIPRKGSIESVQITSGTVWKVSANPSWIIVSPSSGPGSGTVVFRIDSNRLVASRTGNIIIKAPNGLPDSLSVTISLSQLGSDILDIDRKSIITSAAAKTETVTLTSSTDWNITHQASWVSILPLNGSGNALLNLLFQANSSTNNRTDTITIKAKNLPDVKLIATQSGTSLSYLNPSVNQVNIGPVNGDTASIVVSSNIKWKIVSSISWMITNPASWIAIDGDKKINITLDTKYFSILDLTGKDIQGAFTLEEDSSLPTRIIKTIAVTLKAYPAVLKIPTHTFTFKGTESTILKVESNLPWSAEKKATANWLTIFPSYATGNADMILGCNITNASSKDNSVYLIIHHTNGLVKDSILLVQAGSSVGVVDYEHSGVKIYPQPAGETLNIDLPVNSEFKYWEIYNPTGIELLKGTIENKNKLQIPVQRLSPGLYFITLRSDSKKIGLKFTK